MGFLPELLAHLSASPCGFGTSSFQWWLYRCHCVVVLESASVVLRQTSLVDIHLWGSGRLSTHRACGDSHCTLLTRRGRCKILVRGKENVLRLYLAVHADIPHTLFASAMTVANPLLLCVTIYFATAREVLLLPCGPTEDGPHTVAIKVQTRKGSWHEYSAYR